MFTIGETVGLAEWIIDDICLVLYKYVGYCVSFLRHTGPGSE